MEHKAIDLVVGGVFVLLYSAQRFNTPATNRSSTTAGRFFLAVCIHGLAAVSAYAALVEFPHLLSFLAEGQADAVPETVKTFSSPLMVALLMTVLLPKLPVLSTVDTWICRQLQAMAAIPGEVRRLSAELRRQRVALRPEVQVGLAVALEADGFDKGDIRFDHGQTPMGRWSLLSAHLGLLEDWDRDRRMVGYLQECGEVLEKLRERHTALRAKAKTCFRLLRETSAQPDTDRAREAARQYAEDFSDQIEQLHRELLDFVSRGVLRAELTDGARNARLAALGFTVTEPQPPLSLNEMMFLFGVFGIVLLSGYVLLTPPTGVRTGVILARAIMISVIYSVAVACAVFPKQRFSLARREPGGFRPVVFYLLSGLAAVAITQLIGLGFSCVLERGFAAGVQRHRLTYPWGLLTFTTSVMTGILVDDAPTAPRPRLRRALEGLAGAAMMCAGTWLTHRWLLEVYNRASQWRPPDYRVGSLARVLIMSAVVGFVIGFLVPHWYRRAPRQRAQAPQAAPQAEAACADSALPMPTPVVADQARAG